MKSPETRKAIELAVAARERVLRPFQRRTPGRRSALLRGELAFVALAAFGLAAALPGVHRGLQLGLAASGYLSFVLLFRSAMKRWRTDWDALSDDGRYRRRRQIVFAPSIDAGLDAGPTASLAQQNVLNVRRSPVGRLETGPSRRTPWPR